MNAQLQSMGRPAFHGGAFGHRQTTGGCGTCGIVNAGLSAGYDQARLAELGCTVESVGPFHAGDFIFRRGDPFDAIYALRLGIVKMRKLDECDHEQVMGFFLPGEVIGIGAIDRGRFPCDAIALDTTFLCRVSFHAVSAIAAQVPAVQQHLLRTLSQRVGEARRLTCDSDADARVAAFLLDLHARAAARGTSTARVHLQMPRTDIANYLRLAAETVSRVLTRLRARRMIDVHGRDVDLLDVRRLEQMGCSAEARAGAC